MRNYSSPATEIARLKPLRRFFWAVGILAAGSHGLAQEPERYRVYGEVRDAGSGTGLDGAHVQIEGPTLVDQENYRMRLRDAPGGKFEFKVPPGSYDLWSERDNYQRSETKIVVSGDLEVNLDLSPMARSYAYRVEDVPLPRQMIPEVSGVDFTPSGRLVITNRRGEVWIRDLDGETWNQFAYGLYEPFGVVAHSDSEILVIQRPEITRVRDTDADGEADQFETVSDSWGITGNYHEFSYGLARDSRGNLYGGLGMVSAGDFPWTRGELKLDRKVPWTGPGRVPDGHRSVVPYQGWIFQVTPEGEFVPWASGFRQPLGIGVSPDDELFVTDVSGAWVPTSLLHHVKRGKFYGHPDGLKWHPEFRDQEVSMDLLEDMRTLPAVYLPRGPLGGSPGQPIWDSTGGKFGPFSGQMLFGDVFSLFMRIDLEEVAGEYQGAAFPFLRDQGLTVGNMHNRFGPDGSLYIGQTVRGWTTGKEGLQRIVWTGRNPVEVLNMRLTERGFRLTFTEPMEFAALGNRDSYQVKRFQYNYHILDGSLRQNEVEVPLIEVRTLGDGREVELVLEELQPGFVYELQLDETLSGQSGRPILNPSAYYTLNRLLSGETRVGPSKLIPAAEVSGPVDPKAGGETFRLYCMVCHQEDGSGSVQVGTPDFKTAGGPLSQPDEALIRSITEGKGEIMPAFGNVLRSHEIESVLAYIRQTFGAGK